MSMISFSAYRLADSQFSWAAGLEDMGFDGWEIVSEGEQRITTETLPEIKDILSTGSLKITVHGPFSNLNPASLNEPLWNETIKKIKQCVELSSDFSDIVVVHPGLLLPPGNEMPDKAWGRNVEALKILCDHAKDFGVTLCLENMPDMEKLLCRTPGELFGMVESVGRDNLGVTFDAGHANTMKNTASFVKDCRRFTHAHVHDNKGVKDEHLELGAGTADWDSILPALLDLDITMVVEGRSLEEGSRSLEFIRKWQKGRQ